MDTNNKKDYDIIDDDLYENIDDEKMYELVQEAHKEAWERARQEKEAPKPKRPFPKWAFWLIAFAMVLNMVALLPQTFSIPAIDFLITSTKLSTQDHIKTYKKAVVVIETDDSRGTGFSISSDGVILTNHHVVEGEETVTVAFPEHGLLTATVTYTYPDIDLAVLETNATDAPYLTLAEQADVTHLERVEFIGNPLKFQGIANEGEVIDYTKLRHWDEEVLMIKAPIYRGNSGSPIINEYGEVIGIVFATLQHDDHGRVGLFIPIDYYYKYHLKSKGMIDD